MRKVFILTLAFITAFSFFSQHRAEAAWPVNIVADEIISPQIIDQLKEDTEDLTEASRDAAEQELAGDAIALGQATKTATAMNQVSAELKQEGLIAERTLDNVGLAENNCSWLTTTSGQGSSFSEYKDNLVVTKEETLSILNEDDGTTFGNGKIDGLKAAYEEGESLCAGGSDCVNLATLFDFNIDSGTEAFLTYAKNIFVGGATTTLALHPDMKDDPDTDTKAIIAEKNRLKMAGSIANGILSDALAKAKVPTSGSNSVQYLLDVAKEGGYLSDSVLAELASGNSASYKAQRELLNRGAVNPNYMREKTHAEVKDFLATNVVQNALNNQLLLDVIQQLEQISVSNAILIGLQSKPLQDDLNRKIAGARAKQ